MTAARQAVVPPGIIDVSRPAAGGLWSRTANGLTEVALALLVVLALPVTLILVGAAIELVGRAVMAIFGRVV